MDTKPRYEVIIYWSDEDRAFIAEVIGARIGGAVESAMIIS